MWLMLTSHIDASLGCILGYRLKTATFSKESKLMAAPREDDYNKFV